ncbi:MAG: protease modulator HflC [Holosporales bacterium]
MTMPTSQTKFFAGLLVGLALVFGLMLSVFTVPQIQQALVLQFGQAVRVIEEPGLKFKIPLIQEVLYYDKRLLDYNLPAIEVTAGDQKRLVVDLYVRFRINNVLTFYKTVATIDGAQNRLAASVSSTMRRVIGRAPLSEMLSENRSRIMNEILKEVRASAEGFGVGVIDVRVVRADLPKENSEAIFKRMESERKQEAKQERAKGDELAQGMRAQADREQTIILAEAKRESEILRGKGDAEAAKIYADAFNQDSEFFAFWRSLQTYQDALQSGNTTWILSPEGEFFKYLNQHAK